MPVALGFLNPLLLYALPLAAVPIIIHLLNRRRYKTVRWAAMEFLLRAMKRNRRRLRMEQWLILLLRTLAILLLVLLVARPQFSGTTFAMSRTHHIVCVDDSASMAHRGGAGDAFESAGQAVQNLASRLANSRSGDLFTLLRASRASRPELSAVAITPALPSRVREILAGWQIGDTVLDPGNLLAEASRRAAESEDAGSAEFYVVTDLRKRDWLAENGGPNAAASAWMTELDAEEQHLSLISVGVKDSENLAVSDIRCENRTCTLGVPLGISVEVTNQGRESSSLIDLTIEIDDRSRVVHSVPPLQPGESATVHITQTFHTAGGHGIEASLPADRFPVDDRRSLAIEVRETSHVLLVEGDPGETAEESETYFVDVAIDPEGETVTGIDPRVIADHELASLPEEDLAGSDMIWLCNVSRIDERGAERLDDFARNGGGIVFFLGNQVDLSNYNQTLYKDGAGILPAELLEVRGDIDKPENVYIAEPDNELFTKNAELLELLFAKAVQVGRYIAVREDPDSTARTLLRLRDADGDALMIARSFGDGGLVTVIGTSADTHWTTWPRWPAFLMVCQELHKSSARPQDFTRNNLSPTESFQLRVDPGLFRPDVTVRGLRGEGDTRTFAAPSSSGEAVDLEIPMSELRGYGLFEVVLAAHGGGVEQVLVSRNPPLTEGRLEKLTPAALFQTYPADVETRVSISEGAEASTSRELLGSGGVWRLLAAGMLLGMLLETVLAWRFGRR